jgi:hypothetical protein
MDEVIAFRSAIQTVHTYLDAFKSMPHINILRDSPPFILAGIAILQWRIARQASQRDFSARLFAAFGKMQPLHNWLLDMLRIRESIERSDKFSITTSPDTFNKLARLRSHKKEFSPLFQTANIGSVELLLLLGVHRSSAGAVPNAPRGRIQEKLNLYLELAVKVYSLHIIEASFFMPSGVVPDDLMPDVDSVAQAKEELRRAHISLLNLISSRINFGQ